MIEIPLSTATQRRPFLPFLPLIVSQRRRRSLPSSNQPSKSIVSVVPTSRKLTLARLNSLDRSAETEPLPACDFVPWRFSHACRGSAWIVL